MLSDANFLSRLKALKPQAITQKIKAAVQLKIRQNEDFEPKKIENINKAAASICKWVIAVAKFTDVWEMIESKKKVVDEMNDQLNKANKLLEDKQAQLRLVLNKV